MGFFFWEINLLIKKLTSENDDNSRLEKLRFQSSRLSFRPDKSAFQIWKQSNTYKLLVICQNDNEVSVDGMDVHAADKPYSVLCIFIQGIYSDMLLNYINNMSLFKNFKYEILHLWWTRSGEVGSVEMGCWPMRGGGVLTPLTPP